ncbi:alpha/beta fold hydrolase [Novosphingobium malaysiense]|uniref:2-hydroxy-6-oxo-2,4-heptadienoate hydrolase n=1 Tax=Novosphingobium malaysiense TaxID=1348853 RepID=A0A0B1ZKH2_9SPHN|nr:alpha/beta hydrolase [Novosphingobium malaysiense]KHK89790.1 2-hydroxy-6-oxo-2,4-heptadienoate hydrolase [Novosphingobium malaysiense]
MPDSNPEIGKTIVAAGIKTNIHDVGTGKPVLLIHGSGPGVSAYANWRLVIPKLSEHYRVLAPDMVGFGFTDRPEGIEYSMNGWVDHALGVLDALKLDKVHLVGNSFGGALALALTTRHPDRVSRLALMGATGVPFELTPALDAVWGYEPSVENMRKMMDLFAYDRSIVTDELAQVRYAASIRPGIQEAFSAMFPAPRQRWVDAMCSSEEAIRGITQDTMIIHGRDDLVIPLQTSLTLLDWIPRSQLHVFGQCGHWSQIEHSARFTELLKGFFAEAD